MEGLIVCFAAVCDNGGVRDGLEFSMYFPKLDSILSKS